MRVHIYGLLPLITSSVVEYPNGDEVVTTLIYERLDKHCTKCLRLDHELKECLVARAEAKAQKAQQIEEPTRMSASSVHEEASTRHRTVTSTKKNRGLNGQAPTNEVLNSLPHQRITFVTEELIRNHKTTHTVGHTSLKP